MIVLNALSQPLPTLTSSQVLREPNPWRCPVPPSVPAPVPAEIRSCWMSCVVLVRIPRWQRQHFTSNGSSKDAAPRLPWGVFGVCRDGCRSNPKRMERPRRQQGRGCAGASAERVEFPARAGLCSGSPGSRRAREELSCPSLHKQRPPAPPRSRGEVTPSGEPLIGT